MDLKTLFHEQNNLHFIIRKLNKIDIGWYSNFINGTLYFKISILLMVVWLEVIIQRAISRVRCTCVGSAMIILAIVDWHQVSNNANS